MKKPVDKHKQVIKSLRLELAKMKSERDASVAFLQQVIEQRRSDVAERLFNLSADDSILMRTCLSPHHKENIIIGRHHNKKNKV